MKKGIIVLVTGLMFALSACGSKGAEGEMFAEDVAVVEEMGSTEAEKAVEQETVKNAGETGTEPDTADAKGTTSKTIEEMLTAWEETFESVFLEDITAALNRENIIFTAEYNRSGERIDIELEDGRKLMFLRVTDSDMNDLGYKLIMKDGVLDGASFQEQYLNAYDVIFFDYYAPQMSEEPVDENWLAEMNQTDLSIVRNEIYAKYGRDFTDPFLKAVFSLKEWYEPEYSPQEFDALSNDFLTDIEKENLARITNYEVECGYRKKSGDSSIDVDKVVSGSWYDLDGDGSYEQVFYEKDESDPTKLPLACMRILSKEDVDAGKEDGILVSWETDSFHDDGYVFSMDGKTKYLAMGDYGLSGDDVMKIYRYEPGKVEEVGCIYDDPNTIIVYPDYIEASERYDHICSQFITFHYVIKNGRFERVIEDYYEYYQHADIVTMQDIVLHTEKDINSTPITVAEGEELEMLGGDVTEWVRFRKVATGQEGWLYVKECKCMLPDGSMVYTGEVFDELAWFG